MDQIVDDVERSSENSGALYKASIYKLLCSVIKSAAGKTPTEIDVQVEELTNQEEVELRAKIEALGLEVTKVPAKSAQHLDELEIAQELDKLSAKLDDVDEMISSAMASDPQVQSLLSGTANVWMPVITAGADERRNFTASVGDDNLEGQGNNIK